MTKSRFAEAAGRLDRSIEELKARQYDAAGTKPPPAPAPVRRPRNPDEAWAKSFATHAIPRRGESAPPPPAYRGPQPERPPVPDAFRAKPAEQAPESNASGHIGGVLGKPAKRYGILARLFRGRQG